jgi:acetoin:2,6-dichlorophenolindophenol oxidoreductase subunit beta
MSTAVTTTYRNALRAVLQAEMRTDARVVLLGENLNIGGPFKVTRDLVNEFGKTRVIETPVVENAIVGGALGLALAGKVVVAEIFNSDFLFTAGNEIVNDIPKWRFQHGRTEPLHLVIRCATGAIGGQGPEHSQCIEGYLLHIPGLQVIMPGTAKDAAGLLRAALRSGKPTVFLEHKQLYSQEGEAPPTADYQVPIGKAQVVRSGRDITVVSWARLRHEAEHAAVELEDLGISAEIIDLRTISPLDFETILNSVRRTRRLLVVEESYRTGGVGAEILAQVFEELGQSCIAGRRLAMLDAPVPFSAQLERQLTLDRQTIVAAVRELLTENHLNDDITAVS